MLFDENKLELSSPIKWAGGKGFLLEKVRHHLTQNSNCEWFVEGFAGSLAITLHYQPKKVVINDICFPLINMWTQIKENADVLCVLLEELSESSYNKKEKFNEIREEFNDMKNRELVLEEKIKLAAYFIYLNKRSFNGLYRENSSGIYNVPFRQYKDGLIYSEDNIKEISKYFNENEVIFSNLSFENLEVPDNSLVYLDPPYYPCDTSSFTQYNKDGFTKEKQEELRNFCVSCVADGNKFLQSNAPCDEIDELYEQFNRESFLIKRSMRSAQKGKKDEENMPDNEILIWN